MLLSFVVSIPIWFDLKIGSFGGPVGSAMFQFLYGSI